jgi:hypothetical protein
MTKQSKSIWLLVFIAAFAAFACNLPTNTNQSREESGAMFTQAAETLAVYLTQTQVATLFTPQVVFTETPFFPTATATSEPTNTPIPVVEICDWAQYLKDVTIPDGTVLTPNAEFVKTWRLQNIGVCTWNSDYDLVFDEGDGMNGDSSSSIGKMVYPGNTVDVSVSLKAPKESGHYRGYWKLRNQYNAIFGVGGNADMPFWVDIKVRKPSNDKYDFATNVCLADWESGEDDNLPCPGTKNDEDGFVLFLTNPDLENRQENEPAIHTHPDYDDSGWISGEYPAIKINDDDHFMGWIGCLDDSKNCDVTFRLKYQIGSDPVQTLGEWDEVYDGDVTKLDIDLSALDGEKVKFIFEVEVNGGKASKANAFWFVPRIED